MILLIGNFGETLYCEFEKHKMGASMHIGILNRQDRFRWLRYRGRWTYTDWSNLIWNVSQSNTQRNLRRLLRPAWLTEGTKGSLWISKRKFQWRQHLKLLRWFSVTFPIPLSIPCYLITN